MDVFWFILSIPALLVVYEVGNNIATGLTNIGIGLTNLGKGIRGDPIDDDH